MSEPGMIDGLGAYLAIQEHVRREKTAEVLQAMTEREQRLVREAAVMGYVLGGMGGGHRGKIPADSEVLHLVLDGCLVHPDLYPVVASIAGADDPQA